MNLELLATPFPAKWFNPNTLKHHDFMAVAAMVMNYDEYIDLWEKLDRKIGDYMHERDMPYGIYCNNRTADYTIYFASEADAIMFRLACV